MSEGPIIEVDGLSKKFCRNLKRTLRYGLRDLVDEVLARKREGRPKLRRAEFMALDDVSFRLCRGECLGLIGANGAGKSTILKMLSGLIRPDRGRIAIRGRLGALIELGAGFNPILSGRENVFVNGALLGLSRAEIETRYDDIVRFSELEEFIDAPVQSYSSGMRVRLGFAVAAHLDPDVLLVDEVLAVGDAGFRAKCYNRMAELAHRSAIVFVSHNMGHVARLADRTLVLDGGRVAFLGPTPEAINAYYALFHRDSRTARHGSGEATIDKLELIDANGRRTQDLTYGEPFTVRVHASARRTIDDLVVNVVFQTVEKTVAAQCNNYVKPHPIRLSGGHSVRISMSVPSLTLNPGVYQISVLLMSHDMTHHYDWLENTGSLSVRGARPAGGPLQFLPTWAIEISDDGERVTFDE